MTATMPPSAPAAPAESAGKLLRLAVVGLRHGATYLGPALRHQRIELAAVVDRDPQRLASVEAGGAARFSDIDALLDARVADAVIIALPTPMHEQVSSACLRAGLHVLQEKVLCRTDAEALRLAKAVAESGRVFQVGYEVRSSHLHRAIMEHIRRGDLGQVTNVWYHMHVVGHDSGRDWWSQRDQMGGKLFDCAPHYFDLMQQWAGARAVRVAALGHQLGRTGPCASETIQSAAVCVEYANGVRGTFNFGDHNDLHDGASFGVVGATGRIMGNPYYPHGAGSFELRTARGARVDQVAFDGQLCSRGHLGFAEQLDHFVRTVLDGAPNVCDFAAALHVHEQMRAIDQALASGQVVNVTPLMPASPAPVS